MLKLDRSTAKNGKGRFIIVTDIKLWTSASGCLYAICMYDEAEETKQAIDLCSKYVPKSLITDKIIIQAYCRHTGGQFNGIFW